MQTAVYMLKKDGRVCYPFFWESKHISCPWDQSKYLRVLIPLTVKERIKSKKKAHMQIVRRDRLVLVPPNRPVLKRERV